MLEVSEVLLACESDIFFLQICLVCSVLFNYLLFLQVELHIATLSLVLVLDPFIWTMLLVLQVLASYWSALAVQSWYITVFTLLMLV